MFNNPGAKIKGMAKTLFIISAVLSVVMPVLLWLSDVIDEDLIIVIPIVAVIGIGVSYVSCLFLAAFGELVETNTQLLEEAKKHNGEFVKG